MNTPARCTPRLSDVPATQNTAPVAEFRCLFTHDFRRKQKRWQDGLAKFHTFNNRVMVYDTTRHFIGEAYWKEGREMEEGDELTLERGGVMVQVEDRIGTTHTDLAPLFEKKTKDSPQVQVAPRPLGRPPVQPRAGIVPRNASQMRHKSLNALLGTPKGPIGKAVTMRSPYETRIEKENEWAAERVAKRQKTDHNPVDLTSSSPTRAGSPVTSKALPLWARTSDAKKASAPPKPIPRVAAVVSLESDSFQISSHSTMPSTPPTIARPVQPRLTSVPVLKPSAAVLEGPSRPLPNVPREIPAQIIHQPRAKMRFPQPVVTPTPPLPPSSPPVSASNRLSNIDFAIQPVVRPVVQPIAKPVIQPPNKVIEEPIRKAIAKPVTEPPEQPARSASSARESKAKSLRLSTGTRKRGMLLCQAAPQQDRTPAESRKPPPKRREKKEILIPIPPPDLGSLDDDPYPWPSDDDEMAQISKAPETISIQKRKAAPPPKRARKEPSPNSSSDAFEDMETVQGLLDAQLIVPSLPKPGHVVRSKSPETTKTKSPPPPKPKKTKTPVSKQVHAKQASIICDTPSPIAPIPKATKTKATKPRNAAEKQPVRNNSPVETAAVVSPITKASSVESQRNTSASLSPHRLVALSTGGFYKRPKTKDLQPHNTTAAPDNPCPPPRPIGKPLPPHPLRANKSGPLMTTTELSALLQKPPKKRPIEEDPIESTQEEIGKSPNRSFRRVRSQNDTDAPIPGISEMWVRQNLPSASKASNIPAVAEARTEAELAKPKSKPKPSGLAALVRKTDPRKRFQRAVSLDVDTTATGIPERLGSESPLPSPDTDMGPWSTEAFDLFDWRPPVKPGGQEDKGIGMLVNG